MAGHVFTGFGFGPIQGGAGPTVASQVPASELMTYKVLALTRIACPWANIPSTTALATLNKASGRELGLMRGANVSMPNVTPPRYRCQYQIYPDKACLHETAEYCHSCLRQRIESLGRYVGAGRGLHADEATGHRADCAADESECGLKAHPHCDQAEDQNNENRKDPVFTAKEGHGTCMNIFGDFFHSVVANRLSLDDVIKDDSDNEANHAQDRCKHLQ